jgi:exodeoxyribonuclease VII large subunit
MLDPIFTVTRLNHYIKRLLDSDEILSCIFVQGEISNFKKHTSGHFYFSVKDANATANCVMFRSSAEKVSFTPYNGLKVMVAGRVSVYEKTGAYQIYAEEMYPLGKGSLTLAFDQLKARLSAEGLFDESHKKPLPFYPRTVAVVTSPTGAAVRDIIQIARRRNPHINLVISPALMQGADAATSIVNALRQVHRGGEADLIILARGGGSQEDLWPFNEERTARAIFASRLPIISGVGHETDFTIADFVADKRAPTPSAAAELAIPSWASLLDTLNDAYEGLNAAARTAIRRRQVYLESRLATLNSEANMRTLAAHTRLQNDASRLEGLSPLKVLKRGYTVVHNVEGRQVMSASALTNGDPITVTFFDGERHARVER